MDFYNNTDKKVPRNFAFTPLECDTRELSPDPHDGLDQDNNHDHLWLSDQKGSDYEPTRLSSFTRLTKGDGMLKKLIRDNQALPNNFTVDIPELILLPDSDKAMHEADHDEFHNQKTLGSEPQLLKQPDSIDRLFESREIETGATGANLNTRANQILSNQSVQARVESPSRYFGEPTLSDSIFNQFSLADVTSGPTISERSSGVPALNVYDEKKTNSFGARNRLVSQLTGTPPCQDPFDQINCNNQIFKQDSISLDVDSGVNFESQETPMQADIEENILKFLEEPKMACSSTTSSQDEEHSQKSAHSPTRNSHKHDLSNLQDNFCPVQLQDDNFLAQGLQMNRLDSNAIADDLNNFDHQCEKMSYAERSNECSIATKIGSEEAKCSSERESVVGEHDDKDDMIYVPYEFQGDGRKREAKRHKTHSIVPRDEIDLDNQIREHQNMNTKIIALEDELDNLKSLKLTKRELQSKRNRLTAQLSRDRQKLELNFLKMQCINYQRLLRRLNKRLDDEGFFCSRCNKQLSNMVTHHQNNLITRTEIDVEAMKRDPIATSDQFAPYDHSEFEPRSLKRARHDDEMNQDSSQGPFELESDEAIDAVPRKAGKSQQKQKNKEIKRSKIQILVGKKRNHFATAGALIATISMIAFSGNDPKPSNALVEVDHKEMPLASSNDWSRSMHMDDISDLNNSLIIEPDMEEDVQKYTSMANQLIPTTQSKQLQNQQSQCQCEKNCSNQQHFQLSDTYLAYDMRESYLQRQATCQLSNQAESTFLTTNEFETKTVNLWRSPDQDIFPQSNSQIDFYDNSYSDRYDYVDSNMQSMFCPAVNMIGSSGKENAGSAVRSEEEVKTGDMIFEQDSDGNNFLHLVLPADRINFLNDSGFASSFTDDGKHDLFGDFEDDINTQMLIEVGCKVFEINRVRYRNQPTQGTSGVASNSVGENFIAKAH